MVPVLIVGRRYRFLCSTVAACLCAVLQTCAQDNISVGQTPQQVNDRIKTLSMGAKNPSGAHDYLIGNGDLLEISVFDVPELSKDVRVSQTGTISFPLVPVRLRLAGLTEIQAEEKIAEVLEANGLVSHPEVAVIVKEHRSQPITVVGAVQHPMVFQADRDVTLLEVLAEAGGIASDAGDAVIVTRRQISHFSEISGPQPITAPAAPGAGEPPEIEPESAPPAAVKKEEAAKGAPSFPSAEITPEGKSPLTPATVETSSAPGSNATSITINLNDLLETGDTRNNITLQAGDVVTVPHGGIVYVLGAVARPGGFVVSNDRTQLTTLKVLSLAGGLTRIAKTNQAVIIRKDQNGKQTETPLDLKKVIQRQSEDITMHASDILYIPDDRTKEALLRAAEIGLAIGTAVAVFRLAYH